MSFFVKTEMPDKFPRTEKIEVANADDRSHFAQHQRTET